MSVGTKTIPLQADTTRENITAVVRHLVLAVLIIYLAWQFFRFTIGTQEENERLFPLTLLVISISAGTLWLQGKRERLAGGFWLLGLVLLVSLFLGIYHKPEIGLLYGYLPVIAIIVMGWPAAILTVGLAAAVVFWFQAQAIVSPFPVIYLWIIFLGGSINALLGWVVTSSYLQITSWSVYNYQKARHDLEEARDERMEFRQLQEDLLHANRELSRLSERLKAVNQVAEEAVRVKEEFVANVSHELRTPLNMIIGFCEMITQSPGVYGKKLPQLLLADITAIQRNSQHLSQLVNDVLDLSQIDVGRMALSKNWVLLQDILREATEAIADFFASKNLYLRVSLPEEPVRLFCDRTRVREVILNLLSNAGRFTEAGGVEVSAQIDQDQVIFRVADTGAGIAPQDQARLFEPFQQVDSSIRRRYGGSGLGLYISKQFVQMHDGKMWLESVVGTGTSIYFSLPLQTPIEANSSLTKGAGRWINPYQIYEGRTRKFKVPAARLVPRFVLLEDGETLNRFFRRYADTVEIEQVQTLAETLEVLKRDPAQAVVLNIPPNAYTATEITAFIANLPYGTPVLSCWIQANDEVARRMGVAQYLVKPVDRDTLLGALKALEIPIHSILLVDDHPEVLQLFTRILASVPETYQVIRARDGRQALELLRERRPDVMLLDLILEKMDGFEVIKEKSADSAIRDIPVIVISSLDPTGSPVVSNSLTIQHKGGLSVRELINCIQTVSLILAPQSRSAAGPASQSTFVE